MNERAQLHEYLGRACNVWDFQGSVLVAAGGEIVLSEGFGKADIEADRDNTPETKFLIGSITKSFTAIAILQLEEQQKLGVDDPITMHLPQYDFPGWPEITIHHLLSHTSGIPDCLSSPEFHSLIGREVSPEDLIELVSDRPIEFEPGARYRYSSTGFILLGMIIERLTDRSWDSCISEYICDQIGMNSTGVMYDYESRNDFAVGYNQQPNQMPVRSIAIHPSVGYSAGALASSVEDMFLFDQALYSSDLLSPTSLQKMFTPHTPEYGYGWIVMNLGGHRMVGHAGGAPGFSTVFQRWLDDSLCVAVFSNNVNSPVFGIAMNLAAIMLGKKYDMPTDRSSAMLSSEQLSEYEGVYRISPDKHRIISARGDRLISRREEGNPTSLIAEAVDTFYYAHDPTAMLTFTRDPDGRVVESIFRRAFFSQTEQRVEGTEADSILYGGERTVVHDSLLNLYVGQYEMETTQLVITVSLRDGILFSQAVDRPAVEMIPLSETEFALRGMAGRMIFETGSGNEIMRLTFIQPGLEMSGARID